MRHIETKNPVKSHTVVEFIAVTNVAIFAQHYFVVHLFIYRHFQNFFCKSRQTDQKYDFT